MDGLHSFRSTVAKAKGSGNEKVALAVRVKASAGSKKKKKKAPTTGVDVKEKVAHCIDFPLHFLGPDRAQ